MNKNSAKEDDKITSISFWLNRRGLVTHSQYRLPVAAYTMLPRTKNKLSYLYDVISEIVFSCLLLVLCAQVLKVRFFFSLFGPDDEYTIAHCVEPTKNLFG